MSVQQIPRRWEEPWGQLAMDEMSANFGTTFNVTGTETAITDLQLSVDIPPGRRLRVTRWWLVGSRLRAVSVS